MFVGCLLLLFVLIVHCLGWMGVVFSVLFGRELFSN